MLIRLAESTRQNVAAFDEATTSQLNARSSIQWGTYGPWLIFCIFRVMTTVMSSSGRRLFVCTVDEFLHDDRWQHSGFGWIAHFHIRVSLCHTGCATRPGGATGRNIRTDLACGSEAISRTTTGNHGECAGATRRIELTRKAMLELLLVLAALAVFLLLRHCHAGWQATRPQPAEGKSATVPAAQYWQRQIVGRSGQRGNAPRHAQGLDKRQVPGPTQAG